MACAGQHVAQSCLHRERARPSVCIKDRSKEWNTIHLERLLERWTLSQEMDAIANGGQAKTVRNVRKCLSESFPLKTWLAALDGRVSKYPCIKLVGRRRRHHKLRETNQGSLLKEPRSLFLPRNIGKLIEREREIQGKLEMGPASLPSRPILFPAI